MPPLQALVALHGLWVLALLPFAVWAVRKWPPRRLQIIGLALCAVGLVGVGILIVQELLTWYPSVSSEQQKYIVPRILYVLGTTTDLPVMQVFLAGISLWFIARRRKRSLSPTPPVALTGVFGPSGEHPQTWMAPGLWLALMMLVYPVYVSFPTHLVVRHVSDERPSHTALPR
jgi:hypothetical protein